MSILEPKAAGFVSRAAAGLVAPTSVSRNITPGQGGVVLHYGGVDVPTSTHASAKNRWKSWQDYHMGHHGWVDIAYTMGVDNWGFVYAGRGKGIRTAANGTSAANQNYYAVCWIGGARQTPTKAALQAIAWAVKSLRDSGAGLEVRSHSDFRPTGCPGDFLRAEARKINGKLFPAPKPEPEPEVKPIVLFDVPLVGKWNGFTGVGVQRGREFHLRNGLSGGQANISFVYGRDGDAPVVGDWNGDGTDSVGIVRGNAWHLRNALGGGDAGKTFNYGSEGDVFITGDWNGDGKSTPGVFRNGRFLLKNSLSGGAADIDFHFGREGDIPIVGDWNGDGRDTVGIFRSGKFFLTTGFDGKADLEFHYGRDGDVPLSGDWHNTGSDSVGVRRGSTFHLRASVFPDMLFSYGR